MVSDGRTASALKDQQRDSQDFGCELLRVLLSSSKAAPDVILSRFCEGSGIALVTKTSSQVLHCARSFAEFTLERSEGLEARSFATLRMTKRGDQHDNQPSP